jgi:hypothetical protein
MRLLPITFTSLFFSAVSVKAFVNPLQTERLPVQRDVSQQVASKGFGKNVEKKEADFSTLSVMKLKDKLLDLLPRMTGQEEEFRTVEALVNALEDQYQPPQTLQFLNLVMEGEWQLLFSTNLAGTPNPQKFRLRELFQRIECDDLEGKLVNEATWDLAEAADGNFEATGNFQVMCSYGINQGARMVVDLDDHILRPAKGSKIPEDVPALVGLLHRAMPKEMFDPADHAIDTTYVDGDLRIVRHTGPRLEGVRDIFIRRGALEINPVADAGSV